MSKDRLRTITTPMSELARQIRLARERAGKTQTEVPKYVCSSRHLIKIEMAQIQKLKPGIVSDLCEWLEVDAELTFQLKELAKATMDPKWWNSYRTVMGQHFWLFLQRQDACDRVLSYDFVFVPALLQHEAYYDALFQQRVSWTDETPVDIDKARELRVDRQKRWFASERPMTAVIGEPAFHINLGADVLETQKNHLMSLAAHPALDIRVAAFDGPWYDIVGSEFNILEFDDNRQETVISVSDKKSSRYLSPASPQGQYFIDGFKQSVQISIPIEEYLNR